MTTTRLVLFAALAVAVTHAPADDPPPAKKTTYSYTVSALNNIFKKDADGSKAKLWTGRQVTVSGTVKGVTAADDGGQTLALSGLPPAGDDPAGCTVPFPARHPSLGLVKGLKEGSSVRVKGEIANVTGMRFTVKNPVLVSAGTPAGKADPAPEPKGKPRPEPMKPDPKPAAADKPPEPTPEELTTTVVAFTDKLFNDKSEKLWLGYARKQMTLTGEVWMIYEGPTGWMVDVRGCPSRGDSPYMMRFKVAASHPDAGRMRNLREGDTVTATGVFRMHLGSLFVLEDVSSLSKGGETPPPPPGPGREVTPEALHAELRDPATAAKLLGQPVRVTGLTDTADPEYSPRGLRIDAGLADPKDPLSGRGLEIVLPPADRLAVWQLPRGVKVRVDGLVGRCEKHDYRVTHAKVTLLEPNPLSTVAAADLAAAYAADPKAAARKYGDTYARKEFFLTAEVESVRIGEYGPILKLKTGTGPAIEVGEKASRAGELKAGDRVRFKASCSGLVDKKNELRVYGTLLPEASPPLMPAK